MKIPTVLCKARSMPRYIPVEFCVPNPMHPACKQCDSPMIDEMKPEDQARLRGQDTTDANDDELLFDDEPDGYEPDDDDFEELNED